MAQEATKHLEVKTYTTHGVDVVVQIDYDNGNISLVEAEKGSMPVRYKGKQWVFANRSIEYMAGWTNILDAMKYAIEEAEKSLQKHQDARDKELKRKEVSLMRAIADHKEKP